MSLSGNLGFVALDEVLRLLIRSNQRGSVDVRGPEIHGRVFVIEGGVALGTTSDDEGLRRHLFKSGLFEEAQLRELETEDDALASLAEDGDGELFDLLREMTIESIYQLGLQGDSFEVLQGDESRYSSPEPFELEDLLEDAEQRLADWEEVSKTINDLHRAVQFTRDLGDRDEVTIDRDAWRVLGEVGPGSSVTSMAEELGTTDFWTARVAARLIDDNLLTLAGEADAKSESPPKEGVTSERWDAIRGDDAAAADDEAEGEVDPDESWWEEPDKSDTEEASEELIEPAAETKEPDVDERAPAAESQIPTVSAEDEPDAEEDTEAFLEKVFSELESSSDSEENEEGYGLLRRRRLGTIKDLSSDA